MKAWDKMWQKFEEMMNLLPDAIDESLASMSSTIGQTKVTIHHVGHVVITGRVDSLTINGFTIRLPNHVKSGTDKVQTKDKTKGV